MSQQKLTKRHCVGRRYDVTEIYNQRDETVAIQDYLEETAQYLVHNSI